MVQYCFFPDLKVVAYIRCLNQHQSPSWLPLLSLFSHPFYRLSATKACFTSVAREL